MKNFVIKGHICYSRTEKELEIVENSYLVCKGGKSVGVYSVLPEKYNSFLFVDYGDRLIIPGMVDMRILNEVRGCFVSPFLHLVLSLAAPMH